MEKKKKWNHPTNHELKELIHRKHRLWSRWTETRDEGVKRKYNKLIEMLSGIDRENWNKRYSGISLTVQKPILKSSWKYVRSKKDSVDTVGTQSH